MRCGKGGIHIRLKLHRIYNIRRSLIPAFINRRELHLDAKNSACGIIGAKYQPPNIYRNNTFSRYLSISDQIKVIVNNENEEYGLLKEEGSLESFLDRVALISSKIKGSLPGELKDAEVREACKMLEALAHSIHTQDLTESFLKRRGDIAWSIYRRLLIEDNLFDPVEDIMLPIHGYPVIIDYTLCHNVSFEIK